MPFDISPKITTNPWTEKHPREAKALADLAAYVRSIPSALWNYDDILIETDGHSCGTVGCALGHSPFVPSCAALGITLDTVPAIRANQVFKIPRDVESHFFFGRYGGEHVTQAMVADRIDHWLATGEIV